MVTTHLSPLIMINILKSVALGWQQRWNVWGCKYASARFSENVNGSLRNLFHGQVKPALFRANRISTAACARHADASQASINGLRIEVRPLMAFNVRRDDASGRSFRRRNPRSSDPRPASRLATSASGLGRSMWRPFPCRGIWRRP